MLLGLILGAERWKNDEMGYVMGLGSYETEKMRRAGKLYGGY